MSELTRVSSRSCAAAAVAALAGVEVLSRHGGSASWGLLLALLLGGVAGWLAAFLATALMVGATAAWHLLRGNDQAAIRKMLSMSLWMLVLIAPLLGLLAILFSLLRRLLLFLLLQLGLGVLLGLARAAGSGGGRGCSHPNGRRYRR